MNCDRTLLPTACYCTITITILLLKLCSYSTPRSTIEDSEFLSETIDESSVVMPCMFTLKSMNITNGENAMNQVQMDSTRHAGLHQRRFLALLLEPLGCRVCNDKSC